MVFGLLPPPGWTFSSRLAPNRYWLLSPKSVYLTVVIFSCRVFAHKGSGRRWGEVSLRCMSGEPTLTGDYAGRRIAAPTYPFQGERYWVPEVSADEQRYRVGLFTDVITDVGDGRCVAETSVSSQIAHLAQHRIHGQCVVPAAFHLAL